MCAYTTFCCGAAHLCIWVEELRVGKILKLDGLGQIDMQILIDWTQLNSKPVTNSANALVRYEGHLRINDNEFISRSVLLD